MTWISCVVTGLRVHTESVCVFMYVFINGKNSEIRLFLPDKSNSFNLLYLLWGRVLGQKPTSLKTPCMLSSGRIAGCYE